MPKIDNSRYIKWWKTQIERFDHTVLLILGGTGAGKTTLLYDLVEAYEDQLEEDDINYLDLPFFYTTRPKRDNENSKHYTFLTEEEMDAMYNIVKDRSDYYSYMEYGSTHGYDRYIADYSHAVEGIKRNLIFEGSLNMAIEAVKLAEEGYQLLVIDLGKGDIQRSSGRGYLKEEVERRYRLDQEDRRKTYTILEPYKDNWIKFNYYKPTYLNAKIEFAGKTLNLRLESDTPNMRKLGGSALGGLFGRNPYGSFLVLALNLMRVKLESEENDYLRCGIALEEPILKKLVPRGLLDYNYEEYYGDMFDDDFFLGLIDGYDAINDRLFECKTHYNPMKFKFAKHIDEFKLPNGDTIPVMDESGVPENYIDQVDLYLHLWNKYYLDPEDQVDGMYVVAYHVDRDKMKETLDHYYEIIDGEYVYRPEKELLDMDIEKYKIYWVPYKPHKVDNKLSKVKEIIDNWIVKDPESGEFIIEINNIKPDKMLLDHITKLKNGELRDRTLELNVEEVFDDD